MLAHKLVFNWQVRAGRYCDENNFTFEIEDVSFQMIHGELSTIKGGSETVHDNWTRSGRDLYAARPATASMRSAIVSFLITPPQSHENSCRSFLLSSKNRCASPTLSLARPASLRIGSAAAAANADSG
jgi:hypothetical protein